MNVRPSASFRASKSVDRDGDQREILATHRHKPTFLSAKVRAEVIAAQIYVNEGIRSSLKLKTHGFELLLQQVEITRRKEKQSAGRYRTRGRLSFRTGLLLEKTVNGRHHGFRRGQLVGQ